MQTNMKNAIWIQYGTDLAQMAIDILEAAGVADAIGPLDTLIGIKPNLVVARPADEGATTHPALVEGIIRYLHAHGFHNLLILEGAWVGARTDAAFDACGYTALSQRTGVPLFDTQRDSHRMHDCAGMRLALCDKATALGFLINVPVLKGHCQTNVTCALKNLKGLIPDSEKRRFHTMGLHKPIAHLNAGIRQGFVLVDAVCGDLNFEEGGNPVPRNQAFGGYDPVLIDAYACNQLGYETHEVPYIGMAQALGLGTASLAEASLHTLGAPQQGPGPASRRVQSLARHVDARDACSACYANLIYALERLDALGLLSRLQERIAIGQGFRDEAGTLGVGQCTARFADITKGCPPSTTDILSMLTEHLSMG